MPIHSVGRLDYGINEQFGTVSFGFWSNDPAYRPEHGGYWHGTCEIVSMKLNRAIVQVVVNNRSCGMFAEVLGGILPEGYEVRRSSNGIDDHKWIVRKVYDERDS